MYLKHKLVTEKIVEHFAGFYRKHTHQNAFSWDLSASTCIHQRENGARSALLILSMLQKPLLLLQDIYYMLKMIHMISNAIYLFIISLAN